jgi:hypothetical protein
MLKQALLVKGIYWHIFPTFAEAKNAIWLDPNMLFGIIPPQVIANKNQSELSITLVNGSIIKLMGSDNPDRLRGAGPLGLILDEYDTMKDNVWSILQPILRQNGGWAWFVGTPKGKQKLYELYNLGQSGNPEWRSWLLKASTSGVIDTDQLENAKSTMSQALYNQEFECDFLEGESSVFRGVRDVCTAVPQKPKAGHLYVMGVDLAKHQDYTVITVYDRGTNAQVYQDRFNTIEWTFQKKRIISVANHYNDALIYIDATGIGDPIADDLNRAGASIEPIKITNTLKKEMVEKLSIWIERGLVKMLNIPETLIEFDNFSYEISQNGIIRYNAPVGFHDDIVIAHCLAVQGLYPLSKNEEQKEKTPVQEYFEKLKSPKSYEDFFTEYEEVV